MNSNMSTVSIDMAKVEAARRREYDKIKQTNTMYLGAKALGFPGLVGTEIKFPYYVVISIPNCFNPRYIESESPQSFIRYKISGNIDIDDKFLYTDDKETEVPSFLIWLLVCMKLFYKKDWDGKRWIDEKEAFKFEQEYSVTFSEPSQVSSLHEDVMKELAEKMAKDIDDQIMQAVKSDPDHWHVQVGNTVYHKKYLINTGL